MAIISDGLQSNSRVVAGKEMPRVTSILGYNPTGNTDALDNWRKKWYADNPDIVAQCIAEGIDPERWFAWRGTQVHACLEKALLGQEHEYASHPWVKPFWDKLRPDVDRGRFFNPIWSEGPRKGYDWPDIDLSYERDGEIAYHIWSDSMGYVGTPDLVVSYGSFNKKLTLLDLKTSQGQYSSKPPSRGGNNPSGFYKYQKTMTQLAMYDMAFSELCGLQVEQWGILVLPESRDGYQTFLMNSSSAMERFRDKARKKIQLYYDHFSV